MVTVFWGAGIIGRRQIGLWKKLGLEVDYFGDNNVSKIGTFYCGKEVISVERMLQLQDYEVHITCSSKIRDQVCEELLLKGVEKARVVSDCGLAEIFIKMQQDLTQEISTKNDLHKIDILFDLQNGLALGGVETWAYDSARMLCAMGYKTGYLSNNYANNWYMPEDGEIIDVSNTQDMDFYDHSMLCSRKILELNPKVVIINFPQTIFLAACVVKALRRDQIKVIAVIHNDEKTYYDLYTVFEKYIDCFFVISSKIRNEMSDRGIKEEKIRYLPWYIQCAKGQNHRYSEKGSPIRLGYAGRITVIQKRVDLLIELAKQLRERKIDFLFEIAGTGEYLEILEAEVSKHSLKRNVMIRDYVPHNEIDAFWQDKDISVNLSDFEGRSISTAEAMAAGAVPVMSDTSGMRDDIVDGYNGFIVPLEGVVEAAEKIQFLYRNRKQIAVMGKRAHDMIKCNNSKDRVLDFWNETANQYLRNVT